MHNENQVTFEFDEFDDIPHDVAVAMLAAEPEDNLDQTKIPIIEDQDLQKYFLAYIAFIQHQSLENIFFD
jgi:hypothetical protein